MYILAIETTGKYAGAAVISETSEVYISESCSEMNHLKEAITLADAVIRAAGIEKSELTHIAASIGPGSFTGIRIGVTTARTLAQMLGAKCIAISSLEALAYRAYDSARAAGCKYICPIINARRHQTYGGIWEIVDSDSRELKPLYEEKQYMIEDICEITRGLEGVMFTGDGVDAYEDIIAELADANFKRTNEAVRYQSAREVAELALDKALKGEVLEYGQLLPNYMRLSEAEQRLKEGTLSKRIVSAEGV